MNEVKAVSALNAQETVINRALSPPAHAYHLPVAHAQVDTAADPAVGTGSSHFFHGALDSLRHKCRHRAVGNALPAGDAI
ncbi:hypothetical protein ES703_112343 [subsurface metagenome]